jgi:membrane protein implicated in regulation of membrane protease activity
MSSLSLASAAGRLTLPRWIPLLLVVVLAIVLRHAVAPNLNVSWDLTVADKVLDGKRLYVDVIEVNPPATVFLYMLPALLGRLSGLPAEFFVNVLVFAAAAGSLLLAGRILGPSGVTLGPGWMLATLVAAAVLILPAVTFGEREHIALIAFLPVLATGIVRARGKTPDWPLMIAAGICGGITAIIKPYFAVRSF